MCVAPIAYSCSQNERCNHCNTWDKGNCLKHYQHWKNGQNGKNNDDDWFVCFLVSHKANCMETRRKLLFSCFFFPPCKKIINGAIVSHDTNDGDSWSLCFVCAKSNSKERLHPLFQVSSRHDSMKCDTFLKIFGLMSILIKVYR
jgi:hypothetical protein